MNLILFTQLLFSSVASLRQQLLVDQVFLVTHPHSRVLQVNLFLQKHSVFLKLFLRVSLLTLLLSLKLLSVDSPHLSLLHHHVLVNSLSVLSLHNLLVQSLLHLLLLRHHLLLFSLLQQHILYLFLLNIARHCLFFLHILLVDRAHHCISHPFHILFGSVLSDLKLMSSICLLLLQHLDIALLSLDIFHLDPALFHLPVHSLSLVLREHMVHVFSLRQLLLHSI